MRPAVRPPVALLLALLLTGCASATPTLPRPVPITPSAELAAAIAQARTALEAGDAAGAIALLEQPLANGQGTAEAQYVLGNAYALQEDLVRAEEHFAQALALNPDYIDARANLGVVLYRALKLPEAETAFREALALAPDDAEIHYNLGGVLASQNRLDDALAEFVRANELDPALPEPYLGMGSVYQMQDKEAEAIAALEKYLQLATDPLWRNQAQQMLDDLRGVP